MARAARHVGEGEHAAGASSATSALEDARLLVATHLHDIGTLEGAAEQGRLRAIAEFSNEADDASIREEAAGVLSLLAHEPCVPALRGRDAWGRVVASGVETLAKAKKYDQGVGGLVRAHFATTSHAAA